MPGTFIALVVVSSLVAHAQEFTVYGRNFGPMVTRRIHAVDVTADLSAQVTIAGDGFVLTTQQGALAPSPDTLSDVIFNGVAATPNYILVTDIDRHLYTLDRTARTGPQIDSRVYPCESLTRCDTFAFAVSNGHLVRILPHSNGVTIDTITTVGSAIGLASTTSWEVVLVADTASNILHAISPATGKILVSTALSAKPIFLQGMSGRYSVVSFEGFEKSLFLVDSHTGSTSPLAANLTNNDECIVIRVSASKYGGGGVVVDPGLATGLKPTLYYANSNQLDSVTRDNEVGVMGRDVHACVAWWHRLNERPIWYTANDYYARLPLTISGGALEWRDRWGLRSGLRMPSAGTTQGLFCGSATVALVVAQEFNDQDTNGRLVNFSTVDAGRSWVTRSLTLRLPTLAVNDNSELLTVRNNNILLGNIYRDGGDPILTPTSSLRGATFCDASVVVLGERVYRSADGGVWWDSAHVAGYTPGPIVYSAGDVIVAGTVGKECVTTDAGYTWRPLTLNAESTVVSATMLKNGVVVGSVFTDSTATIVSSDLPPVKAPFKRAYPVSFGTNTLYLVTERGIAEFNRTTGEYAIVVNPWKNISDMAEEWPLSAEAQMMPGIPAQGSSGRVWIPYGKRIYVVDYNSATSVDGRPDYPTQTPPTLFPNPARDHVEVEAELVVVRNLTGEIVKCRETSYAGYFYLDVSAVASGVYAVQTLRDGRWSTSMLTIFR